MELFYETRFWRFVQIFQILYKQKPKFWDSQLIKTDGKYVLFFNVIKENEYKTAYDFT